MLVWSGYLITISPIYAQIIRQSPKMSIKNSRKTTLTLKENNQKIGVVCGVVFLKTYRKKL